jgi:integrase
LSSSARTKYEAEQAEIKIRRDLFEGKYGKQFGTMLFTKFVGDPNAADDQFGEGTFLDWARHNKRSWKHDQFRVRPLLRALAGKTLVKSRQLQSKLFKSIRLHSVTRRKTKRGPASVKHEMNALSRIFSLAVTWGLADSNPCSRVSRIKLQNQRYRYLLPDEEPRLLAQCTGKRKHLAPMIAFAIGTGARKSEQLTLKVRQCDFFRNLIIFDRTKSNRPRFVEMNSEVREILMPLCKANDLMIMFGSIQRPESHSMTSRGRFSVLARMRESRA